MDFKPNPRQVLYLWKLLVSDEGIPFGQTRPPLKKAAERNELGKHGLIDISPEKKKTPKGSLAKYVTLSKDGQSWAAENMDAEISKSQEASMVLHQVFCKLKDFLRNENVALATLLNLKDKQPENLEDMIRDAYYRASGGKWDSRVRLYELRQSLPSVSRSELDTKLLSMQKENKLVVYTEDDPQEITPEDEAAAIDILGVKKHIVYMKG